MKYLICLFAMVVCIAASPEFHRLRVHHKSMFADEDVMLDSDGNYAMVTVGHMNGSGSPSINFHDLEMGYTAVKDVELGKCFIQQTNHTMAEIKDKIQRIMQFAEKEHIAEYVWTCERQPIPNGMMHALFGERIASFCGNYETLFITRMEAGVLRQSRRSSSAKSYWCILCFNQGSMCPISGDNGITSN